MKTRILIVDDEQSLLNAMQRDFRKQKDRYEIMTTSSGSQIMKILDSVAIDLLITDIFMPDKDGLELVKEVRQKYPSLKIITMSGGGICGNREYLEYAEDFGASCTLKKPFSREDLLAAVESVTGDIAENR